VSGPLLTRRGQFPTSSIPLSQRALYRFDSGKFLLVPTRQPVNVGNWPLSKRERFFPVLENCPSGQLWRTGHNGIHDENSECVQMNGRRNRQPVARKSRANGFSLVELLVVVLIIMVVSGIAVPQIVATLRSYQVSAAASQIADAIKFSRFEAIRRNSTTSFLASPLGASWALGTDSNGNGALDVSERQYEITGNVTLLTAAGVPTTNTLAAALNVPAITAISASGAIKVIAFDPRGAVNFAASAGGVATVYVLYVGPVYQSTQDYRAVVVMPSGITQIWAGNASSGWRQLS
jgi:Tfp pilus assembly protein FimT